jgi:hypothetical protein
LLAELDPVLESAGSFAAPSLPRDEPSDSPAGAISAPASLPVELDEGPRLLSLARAVAAAADFRDVLDRAPLRETDEETIWNDIQRLLLRVPAGLAEGWRQRCLTLANQLGARPDETQAIVLPLGHDEVIYPGLTGAAKALGLRSAGGAPLDPRVQAAAEGDLRFLAGVVSTCLWFIEHGSHLYHCLKSVFRFGVPALTGDQRQRYLAELLRRWERVRTSAEEPSKGAPGWKDHLKARLDLDEALHSLVYQPLADPESWWGRLLNQARDTLFQARDRAGQAGCQTHLQLLGGSFADVNRLAPDSLQVDYGNPGDVVLCLRLWTRLDGEEIKGRVLYRSPREEA